MRMVLTFAFDGRISGEGIDDVAPFTVSGAFYGPTNQASWTKSYIGMHSVEYRGVYDRLSICGDWNLPPSTGGFWIWPSTLEEGDVLQEVAVVPMDVAANLYECARDDSNVRPLVSETIKLTDRLCFSDS